MEIVTATRSLLPARNMSFLQMTVYHQTKPIINWAMIVIQPDKRVKDVIHNLSELSEYTDKGWVSAFIGSQSGMDGSWTELDTAKTLSVA